MVSEKKVTSRAQSSEAQAPAVDDFYALRIGAIWAYFREQHFSFWMICAYLVVEYVRPQSIIPALDVLPWAKVFLLFSVVALFADRKSKWVSDPANVWITLFLLVIVLASVTATYPSVSWAHFMDFFGWYLIYFLVINIVNTERRFLIFIAIFLLASFKLSLFGARTWAMRGFSFTSWGLQGPPGFFQNSGELAVQMLMFSPIAFRLAYFLKPYVTKTKFYLLLLFPVTGAMTVMGASSRGGQVGLVYQFYRCLLKGRLSVKTVLIVAAVAAVGWALLPAEQKARFSASGSDTSSQQRLLYWTRGVEMIEAHPILGVGYFNFPDYFATHYPEDMLYKEAQLPHNIFVQVGTDAGVAGLAIFLMLIYRTARSAREIKRSFSSESKPFGPLADGLLVAMWGFIIAGQFVTVTYYPFFWINLALIVALRNIAQQHAQTSVGPGLRPPKALSRALKGKPIPATSSSLSITKRSR